MRQCHLLKLQHAFRAHHWLDSWCVNKYCPQPLNRISLHHAERCQRQKRQFGKWVQQPIWWWGLVCSLREQISFQISSYPTFFPPFIQVLKKVITVKLFEWLDCIWCWGQQGFGGFDRGLRYGNSNLGCCFLEAFSQPWLSKFKNLWSAHYEI